jgi:hypothetical protein
LGRLQCVGQPCQKQPSTKTANRSGRNTKSGLPNVFLFLRQPVIPSARKIEINLISVDLFFFDRIEAIIRDRFFLENLSAILIQEVNLKVSALINLLFLRFC